MSDENLHRAPTDEPDGTPAYTASLRSPGESVRSAVPGEVSDQEVAADPAPRGDDPVLHPRGGSRAGYDAGAVSGDTDVYRPET